MPVKVICFIFTCNGVCSAWKYNMKTVGLDNIINANKHFISKSRMQIFQNNIVISFLHSLPLTTTVHYEFIMCISIFRSSLQLFLCSQTLSEKKVYLKHLWFGELCHVSFDDVEITLVGCPSNFNQNLTEHWIPMFIARILLHEFKSQLSLKFMI